MHHISHSFKFCKYILENTRKLGIKICKTYLSKSLVEINTLNSKKSINNLSSKLPLKYYLLDEIEIKIIQTGAQIYMTLDKKQEIPVVIGASPYILYKNLRISSSCMNSYWCSFNHRTTKASSNRHRKLQPFRKP